MDGVPGTSQIPRLTNSQYSRTVYDLLETFDPGLLAAEQVGDITQSIWTGYNASADALALTVMGDAALKAKFLKCTPTGDGTECLKSTVKDFGRRAFRRPLTTEEIASFDKLLAKRAEVTKTNSVDEVAELLLSSILKSPSFIQRAELAETPGTTGTFKLSSHEVASRLSYMLWGSMPDPTLDAAADANALQTPAQILEQAKRMAADPKAADIAKEFHRAYIELTGSSRWAQTAKDASFTNFSASVVPDMIAEEEMLFDKIYTGGKSFQDLLTTDEGYVTSRTAAIYGLANPAQYGDTLTPVKLDASRPGFLTRVGFLAAYSKQTRTSPILRGAFVTKRVIGVDPGPPDPNVLDGEAPNSPELDTNRKRVAAQTAAVACATCHAKFVNPSGFVLEAFDTTGASQSVERDTKAAIETNAELVFSVTGAGVPVTGPADMMAKIAASPEAQRFYASKWVGYAYNRTLTGPDVCTVDALTAKVTAGGYSIQNLLADLTQTNVFLTRAIEATP